MEEEELQQRVAELVAAQVRALDRSPHDPWRARLAVLAAAIAAGVAGPLLVRAYDNAPNHFNGGDKIVADQINTNFKYVVDGITALEARVAPLEADLAKRQDANSKYSIGATFCGSTPIKYSGQLSSSDGKVGYAAAKVICQALGGNCGASAHLCTYPELQHSAATGIAITAADGYGWVAGSFYSSSDGYGTDCSGFTANASNIRGSLWRTGLNPTAPDYGPDGNPCSGTEPLLCCD